MSTTVRDLVEELKKSQGFVVFASFVTKKEDGSLGLEHRYMRQQFVPEDLESSFKQFGSMISKDMVDSGANLVKSAEKIANLEFGDQLSEQGEIRHLQEKDQQQ